MQLWLPVEQREQPQLLPKWNISDGNLRILCEEIIERRSYEFLDLVWKDLHKKPEVVFDSLCLDLLENGGRDDQRLLSRQYRILQRPWEQPQFDPTDGDQQERQDKVDGVDKDQRKHNIWWCVYAGKP